MGLTVICAARPIAFLKPSGTKIPAGLDANLAAARRPATPAVPPVKKSVIDCVPSDIPFARDCKAPEPAFKAPSAVAPDIFKADVSYSRLSTD